MARLDQFSPDVQSLVRGLPSNIRDQVVQSINAGQLNEDDIRRARETNLIKIGGKFQTRIDNWNEAAIKEDELRRDIEDESKQYREDIPDIQKIEQGFLEKEAKRSLDTGLRNVRLSAARRGLLNSGLRQGAEQQLKGRVSGGLAGSLVDLNRDLERAAKAKEKAAASVGLDRYAMDIQEANRLSELAQEKQKQRREAMGQLSQGLGYGMGAYLGYKKGKGGDSNAPLAAPQLKAVRGGYLSAPARTGSDYRTPEAPMYPGY